jgi:hypothetical protein
MTYIYRSLRLLNGIVAFYMKSGERKPRCLLCDSLIPTDWMEGHIKLNHEDLWTWLKMNDYVASTYFREVNMREQRYQEGKILWE